MFRKLVVAYNESPEAQQGALVRDPTSQEPQCRIAGGYRIV